ncbi:MAG TPA: hypothetical protein VIG99_28305 [Myxococcaceae bacterium]|jgi:hypothetical protein
MRRALLLAAALVVAVPGCSRCGRVGGRAPELARVLPRDAEAVVLVPDLGALGTAILRLEQLKLASIGAQLQGAGSASDLAGGLALQLGVDLRSRESMERAGLDPSRGAGVVWLKGDDAYVVAGVKDEKAVQDLARRIARDRMNATAAAETEVDGYRMVTFSRKPGGPPMLAVLFQERWAFLSGGKAAGRMAELSAVGESAALATESEFQQAMKRVPKDAQVMVRVPPTSSRSQRGAMHGAMLSLSLRADALAFTWVQPWPNTEKSLEVLTAQRPAPDLFGLAAPDAFFVMRSLGPPSEMAPLWKDLLGELGRRRVNEREVALGDQILQNLKPGTVLSLSLAPTVNLAAGVPQLDPRRTNPFRYLHLVVAGEVKDPAKAAQTLEDIPAAAQRYGAIIEPSDRSGQTVYLTHYAQGEGANLALVGDKAVMAAPVSRLDETITRAKDKAAAEGLAADPAFQALFQSPLSFAIDLHRLAESIRALPSSAWGVGGFAMKATTLRWMDAIDDLRAITFRAGYADGWVEAEVQVRIQAPQ